MTFEYRIAGKYRTLPVFEPNQPPEPAGPPAGLARLVALSHQLEAHVNSDESKDYDELGLRTGITPARISQIVVLSQLAPAIQEYVLFLSAEHAGLITEVQLRDIARQIRWDRQLALFEDLVNRHR